MVYRITKRGGEEGEGDMGTRHDTIPLKFLRRAASDSRPFLFLRTGLLDGARSSYEY